MPEELTRMINSFVVWLPDMDILFNENDECRLVIPWAEKQEFLKREKQARSRPIQGEYNNHFPAGHWLGKFVNEIYFNFNRYITYSGYRFHGALTTARMGFHN
jgi:hypothetical protein